ncbi:MAG: acylphosphatase [Treponema sp.]|jgi:acylphosphatase|nr:acylphosphatase [Treponema sp.]
MTAPLPPAAFHALVGGRVQGVGFRYSCCHEARRLGLSGWVRNKTNGDVEVWAEGDKEKLDAFLQWLRQGPPGARVDQVHYDRCRPAGTYRDFRIER